MICLIQLLVPPIEHLRKLGYRGVLFMSTHASFKKILILVLIILVPILILSAVRLYNIYNTEIRRNERLVDSNVRRHHRRAMHEEIGLEHITFSFWGFAYMFQPGMTRSQIEAIIGFEDENIPEIINYGYTQMLFVFDFIPPIPTRRVTANIHDIKPYRFYFEGFEGGDEDYMKFTRWATCRVEIEPDGTIKIIIIYEPPYWAQ